MENQKSKFLPMKRCSKFRRKGFLWIGVVATIALSLSSASYAAEPISISHALVGYTSDGPTVTLALGTKYIPSDLLMIVPACAGMTIVLMKSYKK